MIAKKQVIFCTYSSIYSSKILDKILADKRIELVAIVNSTRVMHPQYGHFRGALKQLETSGFRYSSYLFLVTDLFRWLQAIPSLNKKSFRDVHSIAAQYDIPIIDTRDINNQQSIKFIKKYCPDYLMAAHFNQLIKPVVLNLPKIACINIHPSILPAYQGVDPVFYALKNGEEFIGATVHRMAETFDTGEILMQKSLLADKSKSLLLNNCRMFDEGIKLALKWIGNNQQILLVPDDGRPKENYDSWPTSKEVRNFRKSGMRLMKLSELWKQDEQ
jgi:methionyl-tRNA formyltransferase